MTDLSNVTDEQIEEIYQRTRHSFELSMKAEGIGEETRNEILATVDDIIGSHV